MTNQQNILRLIIEQEVDRILANYTAGQVILKEAPAKPIGRVLRWVSGRADDIAKAILKHGDNTYKLGRGG